MDSPVMPLIDIPKDARAGKEPCGECHSDLWDAKQKIDAAMKLHTETVWPRTDEDYEKLERSHNRRSA